MGYFRANFKLEGLFLITVFIFSLKMPYMPPPFSNFFCFPNTSSSQSHDFSKGNPLSLIRAHGHESTHLAICWSMGNLLLVKSSSKSDSFSPASRTSKSSPARGGIFIFYTGMFTVLIVCRWPQLLSWVQWQCHIQKTAFPKFQPHLQILLTSHSLFPPQFPSTFRCVTQKTKVLFWGPWK